LIKTYLYSEIHESEFKDALGPLRAEQFEWEEHRTDGLDPHILNAVMTMKEVRRILQKYALEKGWGEDRIELIDPALFQAIQSRYADSNHEIAKEFFGREQLFLEPYLEQTNTPFLGNEIQEDNISDLFRYMRSHFDPKALRYGEGFLQQLRETPLEVFNALREIQRREFQLL